MLPPYIMHDSLKISKSTNDYAIQSYSSLHNLLNAAYKYNSSATILTLRQHHLLPYQLIKIPLLLIEVGNSNNNHSFQTHLQLHYHFMFSQISLLSMLNILFVYMILIMIPCYIRLIISDHD